MFMYLRRRVCLCELRTQQSLSVASISTPPAKAGQCVQFVSHGRFFARSNQIQILQNNFQANSERCILERCTDLQWLMKFAETVFAPGLQQHFAHVGEVIYAAIFTVRGTGKPRGRDQNES